MTGSAPVTIRAAEAADARRVFEWRNDPATRAASLSRGEVDWDDHAAWFARTLADPDRVLSMAMDGSGLAFAVCRFDREPDGTTEVSINLDPAMRGRGLAAPALQAAIDDYLRGAGARALTATIRDGNAASIRIFERAGFTLTSSVDGVGRYVRDAG